MGATDPKEWRTPGTIRADLATSMSRKWCRIGNWAGGGPGGGAPHDTAAARETYFLQLFFLSNGNCIRAIRKRGQHPTRGVEVGATPHRP